MSQAVVQQVKDELIAAGEVLDGACGAFKITSTVAWRLRAQGWGLIHSDGNGCDQVPTEGEKYRTDTVMQKSGSVIDMLGTAESNNGMVYPQVPHESYNIPQWNPTGAQPPENWREPYDPGFLTDDGGTDPQPIPPDDLNAAVEEIITAIHESEERINAHTTNETERVLDKLHELRGEVIEFANKLGRVIVINRLRSNEEEPPAQ